MEVHAGAGISLHLTAQGLSKQTKHLLDMDGESVQECMWQENSNKCKGPLAVAVDRCVALPVVSTHAQAEELHITFDLLYRLSLN